MGGLDPVAVVVPCYNEASRLRPQLLLDFAARHSWARLILVDDGSTDGTPAVLEALRRGLPERIEVCRLPRNSGKAEAVRQGFSLAFARGARAVGLLDADLSAPPECIAPMREILSGGETRIVLGSRVKMLGRHIERRVARHVVGRVFASLVSWGLGLPVYDTQCGAKLFLVTPALKQVIGFPFQTTWVFDVEVLARFLWLSRLDPACPPLAQTCVEHPLAEWVDRGGSKVGLAGFLRSGVEFVGLLRLLRARNLPAAYRANLLAGGGTP